jgi:hypothetical protein
LEGVAIVRVDERQPGQQRAFNDVRARAADLWQRAEGDARWKALLADLRRATPVHIEESHYAPLHATSDKPGAS